MMMKQLCTLCFTLCLLLLSVSGALAEKARAIETDADSAYHAVHLLLHLNTTECHATGNYIKTRTQPNGSVVAGHLEQADSFSLLAIENGWAKIEVIASDKTSPDSWAGMTGWVNADYVDCECSEADYYDGTDGYDSILDWFYLAISEKFDDQVIALFGRIQIFCLKDIKEYLDNKDTENLKLYIQKNFKWIDEDVINAVCKKLID